MKTFYGVVNSVVCFAKEARASIVLIIESVQFFLQNCEKKNSVWGMWVSAKHRPIVLFTSCYVYKV